MIASKIVTLWLKLLMQMGHKSLGCGFRSWLSNCLRSFRSIILPSYLQRFRLQLHPGLMWCKTFDTVQKWKDLVALNWNVLLKSWTRIEKWIYFGKTKRYTLHLCMSEDDKILKLMRLCPVMGVAARCLEVILSDRISVIYWVIDRNGTGRAVV